MEDDGVQKDDEVNCAVHQPLPMLAETCGGKILVDSGIWKSPACQELVISQVRCSHEAMGCMYHFQTLSLTATQVQSRLEVEQQMSYESVPSLCAYMQNSVQRLAYSTPVPPVCLSSGNGMSLACICV